MPKDGFVKNIVTGKEVDDRKNNYVKIYFRFTPSDKLDVSFISSLLKYDNSVSTMNYANTNKRAVASGLEGSNKLKSRKSVLKINTIFLMRHI